DFVDDVHLESAAGGAVLAVLDQLADVVDAGIAGGVDLDHVDVIAARDAEAGRAFAAGLGRRALFAGLAVRGLGEDAGHRCLAGATGAAEEVGVGDSAGSDRLLERLGNVVLADDLVEGGGAIAASQDGVRHSGWASVADANPSRKR